LSSAGGTYEVIERYWTRKDRLLRLLAELVESGSCRSTLYVTSESVGSERGLPAGGPSTRVSGPVLPPELADLTRLAGESETGLAIFFCDDRTIAVSPPFPLQEHLYAEGAQTTPLVDLLSADLLIGVILLRLGRYAVGVLRGEEIVASKVGTRHVKSRHRAGGSSQRRFERSRERLIRELFDKACEVAADILGPYKGRIDYLLLGGERHTLHRFVRRCRLAQELAPETLRRVLEVVRPGQAALQHIHEEVWKSRVHLLEPGEEP
jgi:peptide subunit release factor 1 (eRF1)